jgi:hypothetical protein
MITRENGTQRWIIGEHWTFMLGLALHIGTQYRVMRAYVLHGSARPISYTLVISVLQTTVVMITIANTTDDPFIYPLTRLVCSRLCYH